MRKARFKIDKFIERAKIQGVNIACVEAISSALCDRELEVDEEIFTKFKNVKFYDIEGWTIEENELDFIEEE